MLDEVGTVRQLSDGETVFDENEPGKHMYVIESGSIRLTRTSMRESQNVVTHLANLDEGDFFGEMALFDKGVRSATATAVGETVLRRISRKDLKAVMQERPELVMMFLDRLIARLRWTDQMLERLMVREHLAGDLCDELRAARYPEYL